MCLPSWLHTVPLYPRKGLGARGWAWRLCLKLFSSLMMPSMLAVLKWIKYSLPDRLTGIVRIVTDEVGFQLRAG